MIKYKIFKTVEDCFKEERFDLSSPLFFDLETSSLYSKQELVEVGLKESAKDSLYGYIKLAQLYQKNRKRVSVIKNPSPIDLVNKLKKFRLVSHNVSYEISTLQLRSGIDSFLPKFDCVLLMSKACLTGVLKHSLDELYSFVLQKDIYKGEKKAFQKSDWAKDLTDAQIQYACADVFYLPKVYDYLLKYYKKELQSVYKVTKEVLKALLVIQRRGIPLYADKVIEEIKKVNAEVKSNDLGVNVCSSKQIRSLLKDNRSNELGLITHFLEGDKIAEKILYLRKLRKQTTPLIKYLKFDKDLSIIKNGYAKRIYGMITPSATTGRTRSSCHNLQNIASSHKKLFGVSPKDKFILAQVDFSNLELRSIAFLTGDLNLSRCFIEGRDAHSLTSNTLFGHTTDEKRRKEYRDISKVVNFTLLYGAGGETLKNRLIISLKKLFSLNEAMELKKKWSRLYYGLVKWQYTCSKEYNKNKRIVYSPLGRAMRATNYTDYLNYQNQSFGADVCNLTLLKLFSKLEKDFQGVKILNYVHDDFLFEIPRNKKIYKPFCKEVINICKYSWDFVLENSMTGHNKKKLPLPVNVNIGNSWQDVKEGKNLIYSLEEK